MKAVGRKRFQERRYLTAGELCVMASGVLGDYNQSFLGLGGKLGLLESGVGRTTRCQHFVQIQLFHKVENTGRVLGKVSSQHL